MAEEKKGTNDLLSNIRETWQAEVDKAQTTADPNLSDDKSETGLSEIQTKLADEAEQELTPAEVEASGEGWMPEKEWKEAGKDPDLWKPAGAFVADGKIRKDMRGLKRGLTKRDKIIESMLKEREITYKAGYDAALKELEQKRTEAIDAEDMKLVVALSDEITDLKQNQTPDKLEGTEATPVEEDEGGDAAAFTSDEVKEIQAWAIRNPWYTMDAQLGQYTDLVAGQYLDNNEGASITDALNHSASQVRRQFPAKFKGTPRRGPAAVDTGSANRAGPAPSDNIQVMQPSELITVDDFGEELYKIYRQYKTAGFFKKDENDPKGKWTYHQWCINVGAVK